MNCPRRGEKVCQRAKNAAAMARQAIKHGSEHHSSPGDTSARRGRGHARDYVRGMWLALQHETPDDYIFATGQLHSVQDVVETAFGVVGLDWRQYVKLDPRFMRPAEPLRLIGNPAKAGRLLNWEPSTTFQQLITEMTLAELAGLSG